MALKIRLRRMGRKKAPHYRIVVAESAMPRDGRFVARVGHYNPTTQPATLVVDRDKALQWMAKGAMPTDTVQSLFRKAGVYTDQPTAVAEAATAVTGVAKKAGKAAAGAASAVAGAVASAASAVADSAVGGAVASAASAVAGAARDVVETVTERVSGGGDEAPAADAPADAAPAETASADDVVAVEAEATEPTAEATAPAGAGEAPATDTPVATDAEATEPAADEPAA